MSGRLNAITSEISNLAKLTGDDSPYAHGLTIGLSSGEVLLGCVGSHTCGRLNYTVVGDPVDEAAALAGLARPGETLVSDAVRQRGAWPYEFKPAETRPIAQPQAMYTMHWDPVALARMREIAEAGERDSTVTMSRAPEQWSSGDVASQD